MSQEQPRVPIPLLATEEGLLQRVRDLIGSCLTVDPPAPDADLFGHGALDSLALVSLVMELEREFAFQFPLEEFDAEHFRSARRLTRFLMRYGV